MENERVVMFIKADDSGSFATIKHIPQGIVKPMIQYMRKQGFRHIYLK